MKEKNMDHGPQFLFELCLGWMQGNSLVHYGVFLISTLAAGAVAVAIVLVAEAIGTEEGRMPLAGKYANDKPGFWFITLSVPWVTYAVYTYALELELWATGGMWVFFTFLFVFTSVFLWTKDDLGKKSPEDPVLWRGG